MTADSISRRAWTAGAAERSLETSARGVFNVVDDEPVPAREWVGELARQLGAPAPRRVPALVARAALGEYGVAYLTRIPGASNARAKDAMGWRPVHPSWRTAMLAEPAAARG